MTNLAASFDALDRHADAVKLIEQAVGLQKAKLGPNHSDTLHSMTNLANSYFAIGRQADAIKLREEVFALAKTQLGRDHPVTLLSMNNLADSYNAQSRHTDALELVEEALGLQKAKLGPDHPDTLLSMTTQAETLIQLDRSSEAVPIIDECIRRASGKAVHPLLIPTVMDLRLRHFQKKKDVAGCRATAEMWEKLKRIDPESLYTAACMWAVTAAVLRATDKSEAAAKDADADADKAMAWLKQAVAVGYKNVAHMKKDKDLDALRKREDLTKLLPGLEAGKGKGKQ